jgi:TonB-linked SusC/RagA family outer membrane protein
MKKKRFSLISGINVYWKSKVFKKMRITLILLMIGLSQVFATGNYSQSEITNKTDKLQKYLSTAASELQSQQQKSVSGKVTDNTGVGLPGVSVIVKGTTVGTITDVDGNYILSKVSENAVLQFSFVGMKSQEVKVGSQSSINITLADETIGIDEVVAVGFGTQKRVNVIGSVSQISSKELESRPVTNLTNALTGQISGVTIIQNSGKPGAPIGSINVRGVGSFGATPDALVLIDGIPGSMNDINMNDVESVSVLKDASTAAIYGARAANGVILITTKKGQEGKIKVAYNGYYGISTPTELPDLVNSWEYAQMFNIANGIQSYSDADIAKFKAQDDPDHYPNTNFLKKTFSRNGIQTGHDFSITGGQKSNKYLLSFGYLNSKGLIEHNDYDRYNLRFNLENKLTENLTLTTRMDGSVSESNEPIPPASKEGTVETITMTASRLPAVYLGQASNGDFGTGPESSGTPVSWIAAKSYFTRPTTKANINSRLDYTPLNGLVVSAIGGYNFTLNEGRQYAASQVLNATTSIPLATLNQNRDKNIYKTMQFLAEYTKSVKGHDMKILGGYSFESNDNQILSGYRQDFPSNDYTVMSMGGVNNQQVYGDQIQWAIQSLFGRASYNYKQKYLVESTVRYDGSSRFPSSKKYGTFPSLAIGWRVTEEDFFKTAFPWVSNLKLKASMGKLGNQNIGNYPYQSTLASGRDYPFGIGMSTGAAYATYIDPNIHWESTDTKDVGIETGIFNGKLTFNATYFNRYTSDVLYKPTSSVSTVLGLSVSEINTGEVKNSGWEFELGHQNSFGDFKYKVLGNFSIINNEVKTLGLGNVTQLNGMIGNGSDLFVDFPMQMYYGYKTDGVFISNDDITTWANQSAINPKPKPGDIRYMDISGPDGKPDGIVDPKYDRTYLGSRIPKYNYSLNLSGSYKSFDFTVFLQGVSGVKGYLSDFAGFAFFNLGSIQRWQMEGRFDPENPVRYPAYPRLEIIPKSSPNTEMSDFWVLNASYLRVKNLQIGYTLPKSVLSVAKIDNLRIYFSAENAFTFKHYRKGWDPEINSDGHFYPILATFTMGVNVKF